MISNQLIKFLIIGITVVLIDYIFYLILLDIFDDYIISKGLSFILGSMFSYLLNRSWTFNNSKHSNIRLFKFSLLYISTLLINVLTNYSFLLFFENFVFKIYTSFLIATVISASINYLVMAHYIFNSKKIT